jgi:hypothetical protein
MTNSRTRQPTKPISRVRSVMIKSWTTVRVRAARGKGPGLAADLRDLLRDLARALFDPYRPELHYMRGPGPKWHAKHARPLVAENGTAQLALIRLPVSVGGR